MVMGLNPSTATKEKSDITITKVETVARNSGFDGFVMLNLYPLRSTDYNALPRTVDINAYDENIAHIMKIIAEETSREIWAAWGVGILARQFFMKTCNELSSRLMTSGVSWLHFGPLTKSGHPRHPSRLTYTWQFSQLDMQTYARLLRTKQCSQL